MTSNRLDFESHLAALERECDRIVAAGGDDFALPVPTCPAWRLSDLLGHLGEVFNFWGTQLQAASPEGPVEPSSGGRPAGADIMDWFEAASAELQANLAGRDREQPCWNWSGQDFTADWVCRRVALEAAVHRYDVELAVGAPSVIEGDLAVDGIDEWIGVHLAVDVPEFPEVSLGGVLCLACADHAAAWTVEVTSGRLRWREGRGPADAVLVGSASDLYLYCWNRRPLEVLALTGNRQVALAWSSLTT